MPSTLTWEDARHILGDDVLGPEEVAAAFGVPTSPPPVPFTPEELSVARRTGEMLVWRIAEAPGGKPITILHVTESFPAAFDQKLLRQVGYQLKDEWGIALEPLAATDTCRAGWALVRKAILEESRNLPYEGQEALLHQYASNLPAGTGIVRRRSAVETVYDTILYFAARHERLLARTWDWSASRTVDAGYLNVGGFGPSGLQILSFSRAVRHGALGVCPTRQPPD